MAKKSVQLWSTKQSVKEHGLVWVLEKMKEAGYDGVEFAGYDGLGADELKKHLDRIGLEVSGTHVGYELIKNDIASVIDYCKTIGCKYIICPSTPLETDEYLDEIHSVFLNASKKAKENGLVFGYHNHANEFKTLDGKYYFDILLDGDDAMVYELDTYWSEFAGVDTLSYMDKIAGRLPLVHLKDLKLKEDGTKTNAIYGEGLLNNKAIVDKSLQIGAQWLVIEWEAWDMDDIEAVTKSCRNLSELLK